MHFLNSTQPHAMVVCVCVFHGEKEKNNDGAL